MLLKALRLKRSFTQEKMSKKLNVSTRQYQRIESGNSFLTQERLNKLEDIFELPQRILLAKNVDEIPEYLKEKYKELFKKNPLVRIDSIIND